MKKRAKQPRKTRRHGVSARIREVYLTAIESGKSVDAAAVQAGRSHMTFMRHACKDAEFKARYDAAMVKKNGLKTEIIPDAIEINDNEPFNIEDYFRANLKKFARSIMLAIDSPVASERTAAREQAIRLANLQSMPVKMLPYEIEDAKPENEKITNIREAV